MSSGSALIYIFKVRCVNDMCLVSLFFKLWLLGALV